MKHKIPQISFVHVCFFASCVVLFVLPYNLKNKTRGASHYGLAIYIKTYLKAKEELWKLKYFTMQKYTLQKIL
jgi:hypothetical protein